LRIVRRKFTAMGMLATVLCLPGLSAQGAPKDDEPDAPSLPQVRAPGSEAAPEAPPSESELLQQQITELRDRLRQSEDAQKNAKPPLTMSGYIDLGFFVPTGNGGSGWTRDAGNAQFPAYQDYAWTFLGDILAPTINSRGEAADMGEAPGIDRFDSVNSNGSPGFLVNEINLNVGYTLSDAAILRSSVNFMPRTGREFSLGDFTEVDLAELEYVLTEDGNTSIFVGKSLPSFGIEYKERKSDQRFGITPSLLHRYTAGTQIGIKARSKLLHDWLILAASVTNGSSVTEQFHFSGEVDSNSGKTLSGRVAISAPVGNLAAFIAGDRLELGVSGEWGAQDRASDNAGKLWFVGLDVQYLGSNYALKAQGMRGGAPGRYADRAWGLDLRNSGYVELDWQIFGHLGLILRAEARDALVTLGLERAYLTKSSRYTGGIRVPLSANITAKAEYLNNREYGGIRAIKNDIFTSSLVLAY
jgi:hypothetical protein